jgi:SWIM zinc finger
MSTNTLPPAAPGVVAAAVEGLTSRLRKKLDAAVEQYAAVAPAVEGGSVRVACGEDATVTLAPGPSGAVTDAEQATCTCLLAPRCLHRAAVLTACPVADAVAPKAADAMSETVSEEAPAPGETAGPAPATGPSAAQVAAAAALWSAAAAVLTAGVPAAGAVPQAELLRAAHTARLAGLYRAEAATLRVVRGLRAARARHDSHRLADLTAALRELLLTTHLLARSHPDPGLIGTARRAYPPGSSLRVHGVCREPVISATGYGGVVTHLVAEDGRWYTVADVKPGGPARARGAATAPVAIGGATLDHAGLARGGLLVAGPTVSPDGRLGSGKGVRATPLPGSRWSSGPAAALFARPLAEAVADRLSAAPGADPERAADRARELLGCDLVIAGPAGDHVLARELLPDGSAGLVVRLVPANGHPDLAHTANLRLLAARPGLRIRVVARLDPERAATLSPLAVGPVPGGGPTLRLPPQWLDRADLGYDRLQGAHVPPPEELPAPPPAEAEPDPLAGSPLWRVRRLVELAVAGGRRSVAEPARGNPHAATAPLRRAGFGAAAALATALTAEADRRGRDVFGRLADPSPDAFATAWLTTAIHLTATEQALIHNTWQPAPHEREAAHSSHVRHAP